MKPRRCGCERDEHNARDLDPFNTMHGFTLVDEHRDRLGMDVPHRIDSQRDPEATET